MKTKHFIALLGIIAASAAVYAFSTGNKSEESPAIEKNNQQVSSSDRNQESAVAKNSTSLPFSLPDKFSISTFASNLPGIRVALFDRNGNLWISQPSEGSVTKIAINNGVVSDKQVIFKNLKKPHGIAFDPENENVIYIAEENKVSRFEINNPKNGQKLVDLPSGQGHSTRTLGIGPDGKIYVSIGSSCNVCNESDSKRSKIFSMNKDGSDFQEFSRGLRNTVFFEWDQRGRMWGTDMGRDNLGDDIPPDEINIIEKGNDYGWPNCYGKNIHDNEFDKQRSVSCESKAASHIDLQAHSAPLGLAFAPVDWPEKFQNSLFVAYHGSWNRSEPTGYKIVNIKLDDNNHQIEINDFITGFRSGKEVLARPVDILFYNNDMFITDDKAGAIYKVSVQK